MQIKNFHVAFFFASVNLSDKISLVKDITGLHKLLDGEPLILPLPENSPSEIPRIVLKSKDEEYSVSISYERIDLRFENKSTKAYTQEEITERIMRIVKDISHLLKEKYSANVNRLGFVTSFEFSVKKAVSVLLNNFQEQFTTKIGDKKGAQVHLFNVVEVNSFQVNEWIRLIAQTNKEKGESLIISFDMNTLKENRNKLNLKTREIVSYYITVLKQVDKNIHIYESLLH